MKGQECVLSFWFVYAFGGNGLRQSKVIQSQGNRNSKRKGNRGVSGW